MIAVDTNVLVRILVDDPKEQRQVSAARARARSAGQVFVPQIVQVETLWVLESAYGFAKEQILETLDRLGSNQAYVMEQPRSFDEALREFRNGTAAFSDYVVLASSRAAGHELATFDKRLLKASGTSPV